MLLLGHEGASRSGEAGLGHCPSGQRVLLVFADSLIGGNSVLGP
jgi:hypothetical protein